MVLLLSSANPSFSWLSTFFFSILWSGWDTWAEPTCPYILIVNTYRKTDTRVRDTSIQKTNSGLRCTALPDIYFALAVFRMSSKIIKQADDITHLDAHLRSKLQRGAVNTGGVTLALATDAISNLTLASPGWRQNCYWSHELLYLCTHIASYKM